MKTLTPLIPPKCAELLPERIMDCPQRFPLFVSLLHIIFCLLKRDLWAVPFCRVMHDAISKVSIPTLPLAASHIWKFVHFRPPAFQSCVDMRRRQKQPHTIVVFIYSSWAAMPSQKSYLLPFDNINFWPMHNELQCKPDFWKEKVYFT